MTNDWTIGELEQMGISLPRWAKTKPDKKLKYFLSDDPFQTDCDCWVCAAAREAQTLSIHQQQRVEPSQHVTLPVFRVGGQEYHTQKVAGLAYLTINTILNGVACARATPFRYWSLSENDVPSNSYWPRFCRPCPTVPRHGFVESRDIHSRKEFDALVAETLAADPNGGIIIVERLTGAWSGIAHNAGVTYGLSNDGATGGHNAVTIPCHVDPKLWRGRVGYDLSKIGIKPDDGAYIEFVEHRGNVSLTQLRAGPPQPAGLDWIPRPTTVSKVLSAEFHSDMLAWEKLVAELAGQDGVVVYAPGAGLASHVAVHAICAGLPVVTERRLDGLQKGDKLVPTAEKGLSLTADQHAEMVSRLEREFNEPLLSATTRYLTPAVGIIQAAPRWSDPRLHNLIAYGLVTTIRFLNSACIGEARHYGKRRRQREWNRRESHYKYVTTNAGSKRLTKLKRKIVPSSSRSGCYDASINHGIVQCLDAFEITMDLFGDDSAWHSSFGGQAWQDVARASKTAATALIGYMNNPNDAGLLAAISAINTAINTAHNGGKILTKWLSSVALNTISVAPQAALISPLVAQAVVVQPGVSPVRVPSWKE